MGYDPFSPISLAQVNVLCVPAGKITAEKFDEYIRAIKAFSIVSLRNNTATSNIFAYEDGHVLLNISTGVSSVASSTLEQLDFSVRPQILVGLIDGESLSPLTLSELEEKLDWAKTGLQQVLKDLNDTAICTLVIFGGEKRPTSNEFYFVDLDGEGPSLFDAIHGIVHRLQNHHTNEITTLIESKLPNTTSQDNVESSPANVTNQPLDNVKNQPSRSNSPVNHGALKGGTSNEHNNASLKRTFLSGQLYLQSGQWPEALRIFSEGAVMARDGLDHFWYAKALEGSLICMILFAWARLNFNIPQVCYPTNDKKGQIYDSPSMSSICFANRSALDALSNGKPISSAQMLTSLIPQLLSTIVNLHEKAAGIFQDPVLFKLLCCSRVRWGNLLLCMKRYGNVLSDTALENLIEGLNNDSVIKERDSSIVSLVLQPKAMTKIFIDAALEARAKLPIKDAAPLQIAVISSLSILGVERKQAFYLKEFLQVLGPSLNEAHRAGAAEIGIHPSAILSMWDRSNHNASQSGVQSLLDSLCESYGLPKIGPDQARSQPQSPMDSLKDALHLWSVAHLTGDVTLKIDTLKLCIEVSEAIPDLQSSLNFIARLLHVSIGTPTLCATLTNPPPLITESEQSRLVANIQTAVSSAEHYHIFDARARYWDKCLVRHIEVREDSNTNRLLPHTARDLLLVSNTNTEIRKDPFIFNPFGRPKGGLGHSVIVVGEHAKFNVMLQNSLQVEIEIEDIVLLVEGCDFQPDHHSIVLGPFCSQVFTLSGKALSQGQLVVTGCKATVRGCYTEDFLIVQGDWKPFHVAKQMINPVATDSPARIKLPAIKQLTLKVIPALPRLSITSTSMLQQSLMLLEGETTRFEMVLQNESDVDIDLLLLTFEDSVTRRLEEALSNKDLLPADLYEIQNQVATRPVVKLLDSEDKKGTRLIPKGQTARVSLQFFGRPGLTDITVLVNYTYLGKPREEVRDLFYTRQLRHTITTTVNGSVDIPRCSVLPLDGTMWSKPEQSTHETAKSILLHGKEGEMGGDHTCMLLLDVRNIWPQPLEVEFQASHPSVDHDDDHDDAASSRDFFKVCETLQPGQMTRIFLLSPKILVADPYAPIPSLDTKRQFVVSASKMTIEAEAATRESFWYRERLLRCLAATWKEHNGHRNGQIDMRKGIRLSSRMIDALKLDSIEITFSLEVTVSSAGTDWKADVVKQIGNSHYLLARNNFARLITRIHNRSNQDARLLLRLQPSLRNQPHSVALDLSKRFAWSGVLQRAIHPPLKPNESRELELAVIALAEGDYEINGTVEEIKGRSKAAEITPLEIGDGAERRIWHARRPCLIDATD